MKKPSYKRGPYNKAVRAEPRKQYSISLTQPQYLLWRKLAVKKKRSFAATVVEIVDDYLEKNGV